MTLLVHTGSVTRIQYIVNKKTSRLSCDVSGYPRPVITWQKAGAPVKGSRFTAAFFGSLKVENATNSDLGRYTCTARQQVPLTTKSRSQTFTESVVIDVRIAG